MVDKHTEKSNESDTFHGQKEEIWEVIRTLVLGKVDASQVLELFYWSQDPELLAMLRTIVYLPDEYRRTIGGFFSKSNPNSISITIDSAGRIILSAPEITGAKESK